jgi:hypothetical protein
MPDTEAWCTSCQVEGEFISGFSGQGDEHKYLMITKFPNTNFSRI